MATNQPESVNDRFNHLENRLTNTEQAVAGQSNTIDVLVANIIQLTEKVDNVTENVNNLALQAAQDREQIAQDRQQAAIDRQEFRNQIQGILEYLRDRNGGSSPPN